MAAFDYSRLASMVASHDRNPVFTLAGKNTDYCIGAYLMQKKRLSKEFRLRATRIRRRLAQLSPDLPTYKFCEEFNEQLYYCWHEVEFEGQCINYNTLNSYVSTLRTILDWAQKHGAEVTSTYGDFPKESDEVHPISLSRHEISHMYTFPLDSLPYRPQCIKTLERVRDQFVLNCITYGLRYSDLSRLSSAHFSDGVLRIKQKKTDRTLTNDLSLSFLHQIQRDIIAKYGSRDAIYKHDISTYNKHLKMLCKYLGGTFDDDIIIEHKVGGEIVTTTKKKWQRMSSHVARHTFISINLSEGKPITEVQHAVGHADIKMTGSYAVHVDN